MTGDGFRSPPATLRGVASGPLLVADLRRFLSSNIPPGLSSRPPPLSRQPPHRTTMRGFALRGGERESGASWYVSFRQSPKHIGTGCRVNAPRGNALRAQATPIAVVLQLQPLSRSSVDIRDRFPACILAIHDEDLLGSTIFEPVFHIPLHSLGSPRTHRDLPREVEALRQIGFRPGTGERGTVLQQQDEAERSAQDSPRTGSGCGTATSIHDFCSAGGWLSDYPSQTLGHDSNTTSALPN
jgi:hypothetical protein